MPKLVRFVILNTAIGAGIGWLIAAAIIHFNINGFGDLYWHSKHKIAATAILAMSFGVTFGFGYLTTAILLLPHDKKNFDRF